jgi:hypothetical protein
MGDNFSVITVHAKSEGGVKSGVTVRSGEVFTVAGTGRASYDSGRSMTYPDGTQYVNGKYQGANMHGGAVLKGAPVGMLIARVGSGPWLAVGSTQTMAAWDAGEVIVAYNDVPKEYGNNLGEYTVMVENHGKF